MQEIGFASDEELRSIEFQLKKLSQYQSYWSPAEKSDKGGRSGGVGIIIHPVLSELFDEIYVDKETMSKNYLHLILQVKEIKVHIHRVYGPNTEKDKEIFWQQLPSHFPIMEIHIAMGDFNEIHNPELDAVKMNVRLTKSMVALQNWMAAIGVQDMWRFFQGNEQQFTSPMKKHGRAQRIDFIMGSHSLVENTLAKAWHREDLIIGDHATVHVILRGEKIIAQKSPWCMQEYVIQTPKVRKHLFKKIHAFADKLPAFKEVSYGHVIQKYDKFLQTCVHYIKGMQRTFSNCKSAKWRKMERSYSNAMSALLTEASTQNWMKYQSAKQQLLQFNKNPSRRTHMEKLESFVQTQEKGTSQFFRLLVKEMSHNLKAGVYNSHGDVVKKPAQMVPIFEKTWGNIFADPKYISESIPKWKDEDDIPFPDHMTTLSEADRQMMDEEISTQEIEETIISLPSGRSPGIDGIINAFYQINPHDFGKILKEVFDASFERGSLRSSQRKGLVSLLYKKGDKYCPTNYRPITLMGMEVKILTCILNKRLVNILPKLIKDDQKGFIPGRNIHDCIDNFKQLQEWVNKHNQSGYAMLVDFQKAYDRVNIDYLLITLKHFSFGENFRQWITTLYDKNELFLNINGFLSQGIQPGSGVKQGDPISPSLFALVLEPLLQSLWNQITHSTSKGEGIHGKAVEAFADDVTTFATSLDGIQTQMDCISDYGKWSNAKLNKDKTTIICLNPQYQEEHHTLSSNLLPVDSHTRLLGIMVGSRDTTEANLSQLEAKMSDRLNKWYVRGCTVQGRQLIAQAMILSLATFVLHHLTVSNSFLSKWQTILDSYITGSYKGSVGRRRLQARWIITAKDHGGLGGPNLKAFAQMLQLKRFPFWRMFSGNQYQQIW